MIQENISSPFHFWDIMLYIVFEPSLLMVKIHLKDSSSRIRIRIFNKMESVLPCHTPNVSTKFHPNLSTTFWDIVLYIIFGPISQWWRITLKILTVGSGSGSSPKSNQFVLVTHRTSAQNFIRICPYTFWDILHTNKQEEDNVQSTILAKSIKQIWPKKL